jgi:hypothetical protein
MRKLILISFLLTVQVAFSQVTDETGASGHYTPDRSSSGALGALEAAVTITLDGRNGVGGFVATGTLSGTVTPEVTIDGTTWLATSVYNFAAGVAPTRAATLTLNTNFTLEIPPGTKKARIRVSGYSAGTSTGTLVATSAQGAMGGVPTQAVSGTVTVTDGAGALNVIVDSSATLTVTDGAGAMNVIVDSGSITASDPSFTDATGSAVPANAAFVAGTDGTNTRALKTDSGGELQIDVLSAPTTTVTATDLDIRNLNDTDDLVDARGAAADGVAVAGNPVLIAGQDGTNTQTIKTDTTGTVQVDIESSGTLTVSATDLDIRNLTATNDTLQIGDTVETVTVRDTGTSDSLNVAIVDAAGDQIISFGGGTQYTEDVATPADPIGGATLLRRRDTPASEATTAGDWVAGNATTYGAQYVQVVSSAGAFIDTFGGSGGTAQADRSTFTDGTTNMTPIGGVYNETNTNPTEDQAAAVRITDERALHVNLRDAAGAEVTPGGGTQYDEDTVAAAAEKVMMAGVVRDATPASLVDADGDRTELQVDGTGYLWVNGSGVTQPISAASLPLPSGAATSANQDGIVKDGAGDTTQANVSTGRLHVDGSGVTQPVSGTVTVTATDLDIRNLNDTDDLVDARGAAADGAAVAGNPVLIAGQDGTNTQTIKTDTTGSVQVDIESSATITVTATDLDIHNLTAVNDTVVAQGAKSDNGGVPSTTNLGTLPAVALAADPTRTEGNQVALRTQLDGDLVVAMVDEIPAGTQNIGDVDIVSGTITTVTTVTNLTNLPNEGQQTAANSISVTPDTDNDAIGATAAAVPGEAVYVAGTDGTNVTPFYVDPCEREARTQYRVDIVTATTVEIAAAVASEFYYICSVNLLTAGANNVAIIEDDSATNCPSPSAGVSTGGTTAAEGYNFAANGGIVVGNGQKWVMKTTTANRSFCIITSGAFQLSGTITFVSAP